LILLYFSKSLIISKYDKQALFGIQQFIDNYL